MKIFIRADASEIIGTGHIFRMLVLAKKLKSRGHKVVFLCRGLKGLPRQRILKEGFGIIFVPSRGSLANEKKFIVRKITEQKFSWFIVDHYGAKEDYYLFLQENGVKTLAVDDVNKTRFPVDVLLNQNVNASAHQYRCAQNTVRLLGCRYALVSDVYQRSRPKVGIRKRLKRVLVFLGGADPKNQTLKVIKGLARTKKKIKADIVLGSANKFRPLIEKYLYKNRLKWPIHQDLSDLADLMLKNDLAIGAGGSVSWQLATLKMPMILMPIAENQIGVAQALAKKGAAIYAGWHRHVREEKIRRLIDRIDNKTLKKMSRRSAKLCDGKGASRVVKIIESLS